MKGVHILVGAFACLFAGSAFAAPPIWVGKAGDRTSLYFKGQEAYSQKAIRNGLYLNPSIVGASHPMASYADFRRLVETQVRLGYLAGGFPEVEVRSAWNDELGGTVFTINEGPRFLRGKVKVELPAGSTSSVPADEVTRLIEDGLREKSPDLDQRGASFAPPLRRANEYQKILAEKGLVGGESIWEMVRRDAGEPRRADTVVTYTKAPRRGVVSPIKISGLKRNTREEVLALLGLKEGMPLPANLVAEIPAKLNASGRFVAGKCELDHEAVVGAAIPLSIELAEVLELPALHEELSPLQRDVLAMARRLNEMDTSGETLRVTIAFKDAPVQSLSWDLRNDRIAGTVEGDRFGRWQTISDTNRLLVATPPGLWAPAPRNKMVFTGQITVGYNPETKQRSFMTGFGLRNKRSTDSGPAVATVTVHPAALLTMGLGEEGAETSVEDGVFRYSNGPRKMMIDPRKARFEIETGNATIEGRLLAADEAARSWQAHDQTLHDRLVQGPPEEGMESLLQQLLASIVGGKHPADRKSHGALGGLRLPPAFGQARDVGPIFNGIIGRPSTTLDPKWIMIIGVAEANRHVPRDSWLAHLSLEAVRVAEGDGRGMGKTAEYLIHEAPDTGPLANLATSRALSLIGKNRAAATFARKGFVQCAPADFRRDFSRLLAEGSDLRDLTDALCAGLAGAEPGAFGEGKLAPVAAAVAAAEPDERVDALLGAVWEAGVGAWLKEQLTPRQQ